MAVNMTGWVWLDSVFNSGGRPLLLAGVLSSQLLERPKCVQELGGLSLYIYLARPVGGIFYFCLMCFSPSAVLH